MRMGKEVICLSEGMEEMSERWLFFWFGFVGRDGEGL